MTPEPEVHQHPHRTGHRWVDFAVPLSALAVSVISLVIAIHHGHTMQKMAEENARLVEANSWPLLGVTMPIVLRADTFTYLAPQKTR